MDTEAKIDEAADSLRAYIAEQGDDSRLTQILADLESISLSLHFEAINDAEYRRMDY